MSSLLHLEADAQALQKRIALGEFIVDIGPGKIGNATPSLSQTVAKKIAAGTPCVTVSPHEDDLKTIDYGTVARMSLQDFAITDFLKGKVEEMYICNVFGDRKSGLQTKKIIERVLGGIKRKLAPDGFAIIIENYTPFTPLTKIDYSKYGLIGELFTGSDVYRVQLARMGITESPGATVFAKIYSARGKLWNPFILILRHKRQ